MKINYNSKVVLNGFYGITLYPFGIYFYDSEENVSNIDVNHELIHLKQQKELTTLGLILMFLLRKPGFYRR